jgi:glycosyltransferase involved in cell wall biosynthesis
MHGAELCMLETISALIKNEECKISVILPYENNTILENKLKDKGVKVYSGLPNERWVNFKDKLNLRRFVINTYYVFRIMHRIIKETEPDFVIINSIVTNPGYAIASKIFGTKTIWYIHELGDKDHGYKFMFGKYLTLKFIRLLSHIQLFNSAYTKKNFTSEISNNVIQYSVTETTSGYRSTNPLQNYKSTGKWRILIAGRTWPGKGQLDLIKAVSILKNKHNVVNFEVIMLGCVECEYLNTLRELCKSESLNDNVNFIPFSDKIEDIFSSVDIGVTCSRHEAFGRITVEYLKYGLITIGANAGGTREILQNFINAYKYTPYDYEDLANQLLYIMNSSIDELSNNCIEQQKLALELYSEKNHYEQLHKILNT